MTFCKIALNYFNCSVCESGYFVNLNTLNCEKGKIWGCDLYSNETTCDKCEKGFIKGNGKCYFIPPINCQDNSIQLLNN